MGSGKGLGPGVGGPGSGIGGGGSGSGVGTGGGSGEGADASSQLGTCSTVRSSGSVAGTAGYTLPGGMAPGLEATEHVVIDAMAYANGTAVAEVEVDVETGAVRIAKLVFVHDCGRIIHPVIVEGQLLGTRGEVGFLLTDIGISYSDDVLDQLRAMEQTIRLRVLS